MISQPIAKAFITITVGEKGDQGDPGQNAEYYDFNVLTEKFIVYIDSDNPNGKAVVQLQYNIHHINGNTTEVVNSSASGYHIRFRRNDVSSTYYRLSYNVSNPNFSDNSFITNFHNQTSKPDYLIVYLCYGSSHTVLKQKIVPLVYNTGLLFDINTSLNQITSTVQGHTSNLEDLLNRSTGGRNYASQTSGDWSDWVNLRNVNNQVVTVCSPTYLPLDKEVGDPFTSQITIEWDNITTSNNSSQYIATQTSVDGSWSIPNPGWGQSLLLYNKNSSLPGNGVVHYVHTQEIVAGNKDASLLKPAIRFDYISGRFRYKNVKIERGNQPTDWSKNPDDFDSSFLSVNNSMSQIQQTMDSISSTVNTHTTNINTINGQISTIQNDVTRIEQKADSITSTVESLFVETLFETPIYNGTFFSLSDGQSAQSKTYNSTTNTYQLKCTSTAQDIDYWNNYMTNTYRIDKGKYQISFEMKLSAPQVQYNCVVSIYNSSGTKLKERIIVYESDSSQTNGTLVVDSFEVPQDNCRFKLYFQSSYNDRITPATATSWYIEIKDLKIVMQTQAASILEQKADSITSTVYEYRRDIDALSDDNLNLFKKTVYDGSELTEGNKWEFVSGTLNYKFDNWTNYNRVFDDGYCQWATKANGTTYVYSPYVYLKTDTTYTLNCTFNYEDSKNTLQLCRFSSQDNAKDIISPVTTTLKTSPMTLDYGSNVVTFTPTTTAYYRIRFGNKVSSYNSDNDYNVELQYVRLYQGTYTADQFKKWSENNSKVYTQIQQTGHSISLKVHDDLLSTGIDIESQKVTLTADNFIVKNNSNEQVLGVDSTGNLALTGTVRANNFYHGVTIFIDGGIYKNSDGKIWYYCSDLTSMQDDCELEGWNDYLNFETGKYYNFPNDKAPHFGSAPSGFIACSYTSDIIWLMARANSTQWRYNTAVCLPDPRHFPNKIIEIYGSRSVTSTGTNINITIGCVVGQRIALGIYANQTGTSYSHVSIVDSINISPQTDIKLISLDNRWLVLDYITKKTI